MIEEPGSCCDRHSHQHTNRDQQIGDDFTVEREPTAEIEQGLVRHQSKSACCRGAKLRVEDPPSDH